MKPADPSDAHLADRILEIRVLKSVAVVFLVTLAAVFYGWAPVVAALGVGYVAYKYRYYTNRVGVYTDDDLSTRHDRLEYALLGFGAVTLLTLGATQTVFSEEWAVGGFLSLPAVDFMNVDALLDDPVVVLAWVAVAAPIVALSYVGLQFRQRLLVGIDTHAGAVRATLYDTLACFPVALLWVGGLSARPVYEVWQPVVEAIETEFGIEPAVTAGPLEAEELAEFAVVFGDAFLPVAGVAIATPTVVIASYLGVQRWKYGNGTVPEVLGYRGLLSPSREFHQLNAAVPAGVYLLYALAVGLAIGTAAIVEVPLLAAVVVAVLAGADLRVRTTAALRKLPGSVLDGVDAVVAGLVAGGLAVAALTPLVGVDASLAGVALTYPAVGAPAAYGANRIVAVQTATTIRSFRERIEADWQAFDEGTVDRLFLYSEARDNLLRAEAVGALASTVRANTYRNGDALDVFAAAVQSDDEAIVRAGLRGIAGVLSYDRSRATYDRLAAAGVPGAALAALDSDGETRRQAAETVARVFTAELEATAADGSESLGADHVKQVGDIAAQHPQHRGLVDATLEYFARLYYDGAARERTNSHARQRLLGSLVGLSVHGSDDACLAVVFAVTSTDVAADQRRFEQALDALDSERDETRYVAAHVVHSSMTQHGDRVDPDRLVGLLADRSEGVRWMGARAIARLLQVVPGHGPAVLDPLVGHLEGNRHSPGRTEGVVLRALSNVEAREVLDHPTAASTAAGFVDERYPAVARPAAGLLADLVEVDPALARQGAVAAAIEAGLTHADSAVRRSCLEAVTAVVDADVDDGQQFVHGLAANLGTEGRHGVLAAVTLRQVSDNHPDATLEVVPALADALGNRTAVDDRTAPFVTRGDTVSAVTVDIIADAVTLDPERCEAVIGPLVELAPAADLATLQTLVGILAELSSEFPEESTAAVDIAAAGLEKGRVTIRRDSAQVLANVAAYHPEAVAPSVDALLVATEDSNPRVRAAALIALRNVGGALPETLASEMHRIIGRLDDDSATVRKHAARLVTTVAEREPGVIEPAAEAADRLRRLQRDPAVDVGPEQLQDASTAIQTGVPAGEDSGESSSADREEIWSPEMSDEMGASGETNVFEPVGDEFDAEFEEEFADELDDGPDEPEEPSGEDGTADRADRTASAGAGDDSPAIDSEDVGESDTVIQGDTEDTADVGESDTVIQGDSDDTEDTPDVGESDTVIQGNSSDTEDTPDVGESDTVIQNDSDDTADVGESDTVIQGDSDDSEDDADVGESDTVIRRDDESNGETEDS